MILLILIITFWFPIFFIFILYILGLYYSDLELIYILFCYFVIHYCKIFLIFYFILFFFFHILFFFFKFKKKIFKFFNFCFINLKLFILQNFKNRFLPLFNAFKINFFKKFKRIYYFIFFKIRFFFAFLNAKMLDIKYKITTQYFPKYYYFCSIVVIGILYIIFTILLFNITYLTDSYTFYTFKAIEFNINYIYLFINTYSLILLKVVLVFMMLFYFFLFFFNLKFLKQFYNFLFNFFYKFKLKKNKKMMEDVEEILKLNFLLPKDEYKSLLNLKIFLNLKNLIYNNNAVLADYIYLSLFFNKAAHLAFFHQFFNGIFLKNPNSTKKIIRYKNITTLKKFDFLYFYAFFVILFFFIFLTPFFLLILFLYYPFDFIILYSFFFIIIKEFIYQLLYKRIFLIYEGIIKLPPFWLKNFFQFLEIEIYLIPIKRYVLEFIFFILLINFYSFIFFIGLLLNLLSPYLYIFFFFLFLKEKYQKFEKIKKLYFIFNKNFFFLQKFKKNNAIILKKKSAIILFKKKSKSIVLFKKNKKM